jgi:serine/threonine-protein kinase
MAPEQARGELADERSDVFALGLILYEVLEGTSARESSESLDVLANAPIPTLSDAHDSGLTAICHRAVALEPDARYADATTLERALSAWLDGAVRRAEAEALIRVADGHERAARTLTAESERVRAQGRAALDGVPGHASVTDKAPGWRALEEAAQLAARADTEAWDRIVQLEASLTRDPGNREALAALAALHRDAHAAAVVAHDDEAAKRHLRQLRRFDRGEHAAYLAGTGALTLVTDTPARVTLQRLALEDRRLQPGPAEVLGTTPMVERPLEMGSYLLTLEADGREPVRYPVHIGREQHRHGRPPGAREPAAVVLPARLDRDEVYVPAGWFVAGIHKPIPGCQPERAEWVDGWVFQRDPVTNRAYLAFLDDLVRMGREDEALRWVPRERASRPGELGAMCYGRRDDGGFALVPDADGDLWDPDWPVFLVSWHAATAYASWYADKTGRPWQLPPELAWEKAARGVDGREFPWGPYVDPAFASVRGSQPGRPMPATVDAFPLDVSIYGVRGMAGNVREWCADRFAEGSDERVLRGGCWFFASTGARCAGRYALAPGNRGDTVGFRIARPLRDG